MSAYNAISSRATRKAICIIDDVVLEELKQKEDDKNAKELKKMHAKQERERTKMEKSRKKVAKKVQPRRKAVKERTGSGQDRNPNKRDCSDEIVSLSHQPQDLQASSDSSDSEDAVCPKCGITYSNAGGLWVQCDGCGRWFDLKCTNIKKRKVPEVYLCENCLLTDVTV